MSQSQTAAHRITDWIDRNFDREVAFLSALVRVPSDNPPGDCTPHALAAAGLLEQLGFKVERHEVPGSLTNKFGMLSATNLIVRHSFGAGPTIALNAHGDVVAPGEGWTTDPYGAEIRGGRMYGRGVAVSKSDFATYAFALKALTETGTPLGGTVELHLTYDEEIGGHLGPGWLLESGLTKPDYAISASFTYAIIVAHNGCLHLEVQVDGRSAHAAKPESGVDALEAATKILASLYSYRETLRTVTSAIPGITHPSLNVGLISGGINTNVVPDRVTFRIDRRILPDEDAAEAEAALIRHIEQCAAELGGAKVTARRILMAEPLRTSPNQQPLVEAITRRAKEITGEDIPAVGAPLYTDARLYSSAGIPTVLYGAGPHSLLEANGHRADENLVLEDLRKATKVVALTLMDLLGR